MSLRESLNQNRAVRIVAWLLVIAVLALVAMRFIGSGPRGGTVPLAYFYDLNSGHLFSAPASKKGNIEAPSGTIASPDGPRGAGVRAHVVSCGGCSADLAGKTGPQLEEAGAKIAYLETLTEEMARLHEEGMPDTMLEGAGILIAAVPAEPGAFPKFHDRSSRRGGRIARSASRKCPGGAPPSACAPEPY